MDEKLTRQDLTDLIEAVEAWEQKSSADRMLSMMVGGLIAKDKEQREQLIHEAQAEERAKRAESQRLKDRSILLRAKLIMIRDGLEAQAFLDGSTEDTEGG